LDLFHISTKNLVCPQLSLALGHPEALCQILNHKLIKYYKYKYENELTNWMHTTGSQLSICSQPQNTEQQHTVLHVDQKQGWV
jgi:hypothetical protein